MADAKVLGSSGLKTAVNPLTAGQGGFYRLQNMVCDMPGWATRRRGFKQLNISQSWASVLSQSGYTAKSAWFFDDHLFVYAETGNDSAICAYSFVTSAGWHKVVEAVGSIIRLDPNQYKMRSCIADRVLLISTAAGVKRISAIYDDYFPKGSTTNVNYSTMYRNAGIPRSLDPRIPNAVAGSASLPGLFSVTGYEWLTPSSSVAYQVNWFKRDENAIPGVGAPSGRVVVRNTNTTTSYAVRLKIPIPAGVSDTSYVLQINRTTVVSADATGDIPDPGTECFLAGEYRLTSTDLSNKYVLYDDVSVDQLMGDDLYTNETQEGAGQSRFQPPICRDIATFGGCAFFSNTTEKQRLTIKLLAVDELGTGKGTRVGDMIVAGDLTMEAVAEASEETQPWYFAVDDTTGAGSEVIRCLKTAESFVYKYNTLSNLYNGRYYAYNVTNNNDVVGVIQLEEKSIGGSTGAYVGVSRVDSPVQILPAPVFTSTPSNTVALACEVATNAGPTTVTVTTASAHNLTTNDLVFLAPFGATNESGTSSPRFANTDVPSGLYKITSTGADTFTFPAPSGSAASQTDARTATTGGYVHKVFDTTSSVWTEARSDNNRKVNRLMWSAFGEPESAPVENVVDIGGSDKAILRTIPTQDSLFIFKEDGVWRLKGEAGDWEVVVLDRDCVLGGAETPAVVDGRVFAFSTNGIVSIDDGGIAKVSGDVGGAIDGYYRSAATDPSVSQTYIGCGHSEDKSYWLSFANTTDYYRYHVPTRSWSRHWISSPSGKSDPTLGATSGMSAMLTAKASRYTAFDDQAFTERLVAVFDGGLEAAGVSIERRNGYIHDFCDCDIPVTVASFDTANNTVTLTGAPSNIEAGDVFLWYSNSNYIPGGYQATNNASIQYRATISAKNGDTLTLVISGAVPALSSWPAIGGGQSGSVLKQIRAVVSPLPVAVDSALGLGHFSEVMFSAGSCGRFSVCSIGFNTETGFTQTNSVSEQATSSVSGYAYADWATNWKPRNEVTMQNIRSFRTGVPRAVATGSSLIVSFSNNRALELFDIAGIRVIYGEGDNKTRKTNA